jgi:hypothetical protein
MKRLHSTFTFKFLVQKHELEVALKAADSTRGRRDPCW